MGLPRRLGRDTAGAAAVEFSLVCSILFTVIIGIFNLGWALFCGADVRHGIERASRLYLADPATTDTQFRNAVASRLEVTHLSDVAITVTRETVAGSAPVVRIAWTYAYGLSIPFVSSSTLHFNSQLVVPLSS